jgi:hypothetical protein
MGRRLALLTLVAIIVTSSAGRAGEAPPPGRFGVGDSIMLSTFDELGGYGWIVNAQVGRQFSAGLGVVRRKASNGTLPRRVIVHLGTNGPIDPNDCDSLVAAAAPRRVFLVTVRVPRGWQDPNNAILRACAAAHDRAHLIRWYSHSRDHAEWFADDGYHLTAEGQLAYASYLQRCVDSILANLRAERAG